MSAASKRLRAAIAAELDAIYRKRGGLDPVFVVSWAGKHPNSALYSKFEWNDAKASHEYRLWQARQVITEVEVEYPDGKVRQVYVSPMPRRKRGGYATLVDVLSDKQQRQQFIAQALAEYERVGEKYNDLTELASIREAVKKTGEMHRRGRSRAA